MNKDAYTAALQAAREELAELEQQRAQIDKRISELQQGIVGLSALAPDQSHGDKPQSMMDVLAGVGIETGLTDATRMITSSFGFPMTPKQVRDALVHLGYDLSGYSNILASLHTIMKRLATTGELIQVVDDQGKEIGAYTWNSAVPVRKQKPPSTTDILDALNRAIVRVADGIQPTTQDSGETVRLKLEKRVEESLIKNAAVWADYIKQNGSIVFANPPYFSNGKRLTARQVRHVNRTIEELTRENQ